jgi:hypothetical protein
LIGTGQSKTRPDIIYYEGVMRMNQLMFVFLNKLGIRKYCSCVYEKDASTLEVLKEQPKCDNKFYLKRFEKDEKENIKPCGKCCLNGGK